MKPRVKRNNIKSKMAYNDGGQVTKKDTYEIGDKIKFMDSFRKEEKDGTIYQINEVGTYVVNYGSGITAGIRGVEKKDIIGAYPKVEVKKKRFAFFEKGGEVADIEYSEILAVLRSKIDEAMDDINPSYESASDYKGEEVEHESRSGFIPYTDGGYEAVWFETLGGLYGSGTNLPTKPLEEEKDRQIEYNQKVALEQFIDNNKELVDEIGEDKVDYHSLYELGYGEQAEELSESEMSMMYDDTIMMRILANYYAPENSRAEDGKHSIRLFGDVNLESPYHRVGNLDDSHEYSFTFNSISELEEEMDKGLSEVLSWFNGDMYNDSKKKLGITRMAQGGSIAEGNYHMILSQAKEVKHHVDELQDILKKEDTIEAWVVAKMENVSSTLSDITHYLDGKSDMPKAENGMETSGKKRIKFDKLVGRVGDDYYFLDTIFEHNDGFKGATGTIVNPVNKSYYEYATSEDGILERYLDAMGESEWMETLNLDENDFEDEGDKLKAIEDGIYELYRVGELNPFEEVDYEQEEQMRELPQFSDSDEYPLFEVIGGGRVFGADVKFDEIYDNELYKKVKQVEEFGLGGSVYSSNELFLLKVMNPKTKEVLETKRIFARNMKEAKKIAIEDFEEELKSKHGDYLEFQLEEAPQMMAKGGKTTNKNYEIVTISQGKEGGRIYNFRFLVNANSLEEAKKIAKDKWKKEFSEDLSMNLIDTLSDEEYREKFLRETGGKMPMAKNGMEVNEEKFYTFDVSYSHAPRNRQQLADRHWVEVTAKNEKEAIKYAKQSIRGLHKTERPPHIFSKISPKLVSVLTLREKIAQEKRRWEEQQQRMNNQYAKGGEVEMAKRGMEVEKISDELIEYSIPTWALPSLINGDDSGLRDEDIEKINKFVDKVVERHGNAFFMLGDMSEESNFQPYNDIDSLGADVTTLYIRPSKKFEKGGITYPSLSLKEKDLNDDQTEIYAFIENYEPLNRQLDSIRRNLMIKIVREQFDEAKAPKIFMYLIDNGLKAYKKMYGEISLTKKEKEEIANNMVIDFMGEAKLGNYSSETFLPKKYLNDGGMMVAYSITDSDGDSIMIMGSEQDVIDFANTIWYYDMMDEDGEEIDDFDVAQDYLEQSEFVVETHNKQKSATKKKNVRRGNVK